MSNAKETYVSDDINDLFGVQTKIYFEYIDSICKRGQELIDQLKKYGWKVSGIEDSGSILIVTLNQSCEIDDIINDFLIKSIFDPARWKKNTGEIRMGDGKHHYKLVYKGRWVNTDAQKRDGIIYTGQHSFWGSTSGGSGAVHP